mgnify:CR=1 FL=1
METTSNADKASFKPKKKKIENTTVKNMNIVTEKLWPKLCRWAKKKIEHKPATKVSQKPQMKPHMFISEAAGPHQKSLQAWKRQESRK